MGLFKKENFKAKSPIDLVNEHAVWALVFSIFALALGVLFIILPYATGIAMMWVCLGLLGVACIFAIVNFFLPKTFGKDPFGFVMAILCLAAIIVMLVIACTYPSVSVEGETVSGFVYVSMNMRRFFSIFFGVIFLFCAIFRLCQIGSVETGKGWVIFNCIMTIIFSLLMIILPFFAQFLGAIFLGVYLCFVSIFMIVMSIKILATKKKA